MIYIHSRDSNKKRARTYTVKELITALKLYPPDAPVCGQWDGFGAPIDNIELAKKGDYCKEEIVILDVSEVCNVS